MVEMCVLQLYMLAEVLNAQSKPFAVSELP